MRLRQGLTYGDVMARLRPEHAQRIARERILEEAELDAVKRAARAEAAELYGDGDEQPVAEPAGPWDQALTQRVGRQVKQLRGGRSAQWLSDRTGELGSRIARATISELERGDRKFVTVAELLILAAALDVSPVALLYGEQLVDGEVELIPGLTVSAARALLWHSGYDMSPTDADTSLEPNRAVELVYDLRANDAAMLTAFKLRNLPPAVAEEYISGREHILKSMRDMGLVVDSDGDDQ